MSEFFGYIWRNSRGGQVRILAVVLLSFPFYYFSLDLPKYIVSDVLQGRAFAGGRTTAPLFRFDVALPGWLGGMQLASFEGFTLGRIDYLFALSAPVSAACADQWQLQIRHQHAQRRSW